jgi:hypothetical protein
VSASRITFLAAGALALAVLPGRSEAQGRSPDALTGVRSVTILLERTSPSTLTAGVDTAALRARAEAAVLRAGLTVVPPAARDSASGVLYLNVFSATNAQRDWHAAHVEVELMQPVTIDRKPDARLYATTWQAPVRLRVVRTSELRTEVDNVIGTMLDEFTRAWAAANGR